ncbi:MAG: methionyl-tRNA formyltransferase [Terriglobales bacterium]
MDVVFCGTPQFAVPTLSALVAAGHNVRLVVSQPDRLSGRGQQLAVPAVKQRALELKLPVVQPQSIKNNAEFRAQLEKLAPQSIIVVAYGRIIPQWMIDLPPLGNLNAHASLLPKYRGAAPIQWAIANGETVTGVTTMRIDAGLDTGDMLLQSEIPIAPDDTAATLSPKLSELGAALMVEALQRLEAGKLTSTPQDHSRATLAPILKKEDGRIDFSRTAQEIHNRLRGFQPWPGAFTTFREKSLTISSARPLPPGSELIPPGRIRLLESKLFVGAAHDTSLEVLELQPEGKKKMSAADFINGYNPKSGESFGT